MVLIEGMKEEKEERQQAQQGSGAGINGTPNSMAQPGGGGKKRGETIQYVNTHQDIDDNENGN